MMLGPAIQGQADKLRLLLVNELLDRGSSLLVDLKDSVKNRKYFSHDHQYLSKQTSVVEVRAKAERGIQDPAAICATGKACVKRLQSYSWTRTRSPGISDPSFEHYQFLPFLSISL